MVVIRLSRGGRKKRPFYRVMVADSRMPRDGRFLEQVGHFNPCIKNENINMNLERINYWLSVGAKPSSTVKTLIKKFQNR